MMENKLSIKYMKLILLKKVNRKTNHIKFEIVDENEKKMLTLEECL